MEGRERWWRSRSSCLRYPQVGSCASQTLRAEHQRFQWRTTTKKIQAKAREKMNSCHRRALIGRNGLALPMASSPISPLCLILAEWCRYPLHRSCSCLGPRDGPWARPTLPGAVGGTRSAQVLGTARSPWAPSCSSSASLQHLLKLTSSSRLCCGAWTPLQVMVCFLQVLVSCGPKDGVASRRVGGHPVCRRYHLRCLIIAAKPKRGATCSWGEKRWKKNSLKCSH